MMPVILPPPGTGRGVGCRDTTILENYPMMLPVLSCVSWSQEVEILKIREIAHNSRLSKFYITILGHDVACLLLSMSREKNFRKCEILRKLRLTAR